MADAKLSALTEATTLGETAQLYVNDSGTSKRVSLANLRGSLTAAAKADLDLLEGSDAAGLTVAEVQYLIGVTSSIQDQLDTLVAQQPTTGDWKLTIKTTADAGWVMADDGTIGSATSGASTRANADTEDLYTLLWNNIADDYAPVTGGRGASAAADWAANKPIQIGTVLGRAIAVAGSGSGLTARALGLAIGEEEHSLSVDELPDHDHGLNGSSSSNYAQLGGISPNIALKSNYSASQGGGSAHNTMQPTTFANVMFKL